MPPELEEHLAKTGAVLWEEFTKTAVNKFDIKAVMSNSLGSFDVGLCVLPPIGALYKDTEVDSVFGGSTKKQLDLTELYTAIEQQNCRPSDLKKSIYSLGKEIEGMQLAMN